MAGSAASNMTTRALIIVASGLAVLVAGLGGYVVGSNAKPSEAEVLAARTTARSAASRAAFERTRTAALIAGRREGEKAGRVEGRERGTAQARRRMAKQRAALAREGITVAPTDEPASARGASP
ncbi:MAG: hypothetical protein ACJ760_10020 [Thermoleophilaceae bacterium]